MPTDSKRSTLVARPGRGLVTAYDPAAMGDLIDSFSRFEQLMVRENAWVVRQPDGENSISGPDSQIQGLHLYNRIIDTNGTASTILLIQTQGKIFRANESPAVQIDTCQAPYDLYFETVKNRVFWAGSSNTPRVYDGSVVANWGAIAPSNDIGYGTFAVESTNTKVIKNVVSVAGTPSVATWQSGTHFTTGTSWNGKTVVIGGTEYTIDHVTDNSHLTFVEAYTGPAGNQSASIQYGALTWKNQYVGYAYAYYNPTTGHCSNKSATLTLTETSMTNVDVFLGGIMSDYVQYAYGYTKIILFRTALGGDGTLIPIALLNNNNGNPATAQTYQDEIPDNLRGSVVGFFEAPIINSPPPVFSTIAAWDNRIWGIEADNPYRIRFSGDSGQILFGRPEESFPLRNFRDTPRGVATALKVVGTTLAIVGDKETYYVAGSGDQGYTLERLSTRGFGITQRAIDEHPGDAGTETASAVFVSRDKRLWRHSQGGKIADIGAVIQDKLDAADMTFRHPYIVKTFRSGKLWLLALGIARGEVSPPLVLNEPTAPIASGWVTLTAGSNQVDWQSGDHFVTGGAWTLQVMMIASWFPLQISTVNSTTQLHTTTNWSGATGAFPYSVSVGGGGGGGGGGGTPPASGDGYDFYFYDFDSETWLDWGMADGSYWSAITADVSSQTGNIYCFIAKLITSGTQVLRSIQAPTGSNVLPTPTLELQDFDMGDMIAKKSLEAIVLYTSDEDSRWAIPEVHYNNSSEVGPELERQNEAGTPRYRGPRILWFLPKVPKQFHSLQPTIVFPTTPGAKLYKIEIFWKPVTTYTVGEPS